jgi:hypothetical protein
MTLAWALLGLLADQASAEPTRPTPARWQIAPIATTKVPGAAGPILQFGEQFVLESGVIVFWGRFGPGDKDWALYSLRDGVVRKGQAERVKFTEPDGETKVLWREDSVVNPKTDFHVGRDMLYTTAGITNVYGLAGDGLKKVLGNGDVVAAGGVSWGVENAWIQCIASDGAAVIGFRSKKPRKAFGWVRHDGSSSKLLWLTGDPLPGLPGVTLEDLVAAAPGCPAFHGESAFAFMRVKGAPYKAALFRLTPDKTEKLLAEGEPDPVSPARRVRFGVTLASGALLGNRIWAANSDTIVAFDGTSLLMFRGGAWRPVVADVKHLRLGDRYGDFDVTDLVFPKQGDDTILFSVELHKGRSRFPDLYVFDASGLRPVPGAEDIEPLEKKASSILRIVPIRLRRVPGGRDGAVVTVPWISRFGEGLEWFFDPSSAPAALTRPPIDVGGGRSVYLSSVAAWTGPETAIVRLSDGYYQLTPRR